MLITIHAAEDENESMTAPSSMPSSSSLAPAANGMHSMPLVSVPVRPPTYAFKNGHEPVCFTNYGNKGLLEYDKKEARLEMTSNGWGDDEDTARRGKNTGNNPTDRGKTGTKRSFLTDGNCLLIDIVVDGANRHDSQLVKLTLQSIPIKRPKVRYYHRQHLCLNAGYVGGEVAVLAKVFCYSLHLRPLGEEAKGLRKKAGARARRWMVERTHR